ncbi:MAG: stage II sporulation protein M [Verrucomicrobiales bacterium]|nr:stage II sporulation protein M [Verrucomicrobiales bacterium]
MIIDLPRFIASERPYWSELEGWLDRMESDPGLTLDLGQVKRFHYLYQRASADLARLATFASEPEMGRYLESLVARGYAEIHATRESPRNVAIRAWFLQVFPQTFRRHINAFWLSVAITVVGSTFGIMAVALDSEAKRTLLPFEHLQGDPAERVAQEERMEEDRLEGGKATFSAALMTHNTRVAVFTLALGITWGVGSIIVLFYNGIILGAVAFDYVRAGQAKFLAGWLLPHGVIEIPAILIAGQAGLLLASALIGWGRPGSVRTRLRAISRDLVTLIGGVGVMLVWAGFVESFLSQYHEPVIPYAVKIGFGLTELALLAFFLAKGGSKSPLNLNPGRSPAPINCSSGLRKASPLRCAWPGPCAGVWLGLLIWPASEPS